MSCIMSTLCRTAQGTYQTQILLRWDNFPSVFKLKGFPPLFDHDKLITGAPLLFCTRFCRQETSCPQEDYYPKQCYVRVNSHHCPIPVRPQMRGGSPPEIHDYMYTSLLWCSLRLHVHVNNQTAVGTSLVPAVSPIGRLLVPAWYRLSPRSDGCWYQPGTSLVLAVWEPSPLLRLIQFTSCSHGTSFYKLKPSVTSSLWCHEAILVHVCLASFLIWSWCQSHDTIYTCLCPYLVVHMTSLSEAALMVCTLTYCPGVPSTAVNKARLQEKWQSCKYHKLCEDLSCSGQRGGYILGTRYSLPYGMCVCVGGGREGVREWWDEGYIIRV